MTTFKLNSAPEYPVKLTRAELDVMVKGLRVIARGLSWMDAEEAKALMRKLEDAQGYARRVTSPTLAGKGGSAIG